MTTKATGTCCAKQYCTTPHMQLWKSGHNCSVCKGIVHLKGICSTSSLDENGDDVFVCTLCANTKANSSSTVEKEVIGATDTGKKVKRCPKCQGTDHQRSSSHLCKYTTISTCKPRRGKKTKVKSTSTTMVDINPTNTNEALLCKPVTVIPNN